MLTKTSSREPRKQATKQSSLRLTVSFKEKEDAVSNFHSSFHPTLLSQISSLPLWTEFPRITVGQSLIFPPRGKLSSGQNRTSRKCMRNNNFIFSTFVFLQLKNHAAKGYRERNLNSGRCNGSNETWGRWHRRFEPRWKKFGCG